MLMIKVNIDEDMKVTIAQFIGGLNKEIADVVELHILCGDRGFDQDGNESREIAKSKEGSQGIFEF